MIRGGTVTRYLDAFNRRGMRLSVQQDGDLQFDPDYLLTDDLATMAREHKERIIEEIRESAGISSDDHSDTAREIVPAYRFLWVATDLTSFEEYDPRLGYEIGRDPVFRMLDAAYYSWLRHRMENARKAHKAGRLDSRTFDTLRERFNVIHDWAITHLGEQSLREALGSTDLKSYVPPSESTIAEYHRSWDEAQRAHRAAVTVDTKACRPESFANSERLAKAAQLGHLLDTQGYAVIRWPPIDDVVIIVRDDAVTLPTKLTGKPAFDLDEIRLMVGASPEVVKQICEVKQIFGGKVVPDGDRPRVVREKSSRDSASVAQGSMF